MVTVGEMTFETVSQSMDMIDARCEGAPSEASFAGTAAVGSINRFLPRDARYFVRREDRFLGYEDLPAPGGTRRCSVWGWLETEAQVEVGFHKVYIAVRNGWSV